jgi:hypothetical protein
MALKLNGIRRVWLDVSRQGLNTPVEFGDRRGISKAQIIAEEKAKAAIVRFLGQAISSTRVIGEVQNDLNKATQQRESGNAPNVKKVDKRTMIEGLTEVTTSFASGQLRRPSPRPPDAQ